LRGASLAKGLSVSVRSESLHSMSCNFERSEGALIAFRGQARIQGSGSTLLEATGQYEPDRIIGDTRFTNVANEVFKFLSGNANASLTSDQMNALIDAIIKRCGPKAKDLKITRPSTGGGGVGDAGGGFGGFDSWRYALYNFLQWLYSIPAFVKEEEDHLA
jgi:hypothetical protein